MSVSLCTLKEGMSYTKQLPAKGLKHEEVLDKIKEYQSLSKSMRIILRFSLYDLCQNAAYCTVVVGVFMCSVTCVII